MQGHYVDGILHGPGRGRLTSGLSFQGRFNNGFLGTENTQETCEKTASPLVVFSRADSIKDTKRILGNILKYDLSMAFSSR